MPEAQVELNPEGRAHLLNPSGVPVTLPVDQVAAAIDAGYQPEAREAITSREEKKKYGTLGQQALTAAESATSGATVGLSDVALGEILGPDYGQQVLKRRAYNPLTAGVSEVAGAVAPLLASGGTSLAARGVAEAGLLTRGAAEAGSLGGRLARAGVTALAGEGRVARMAARAAELATTGGIEGLLYGTGRTAGDLALQGEDLTAEKLVSSGAANAGIGALAGLGVGGVGALLGSLGRKLTPDLKALRNDSVLKALGARGSDLRKVAGRRGAEAAEQKLDTIADDIFDYRLRTGPLKGERIFSGAKKAEDFVDDLAHAKDELGAELGAIRKTIADEPVQLTPFLNRVDEEVLGPLKASQVPEIQRRAAAIEKQLEPLRLRQKQIAEDLADSQGSPMVDPPQPATFGELEQYRKDLAEIVYPKKPAAGGPPAPVAPEMEKLQSVERILDDELDKAAGFALGAEKVAPYKETQRLYSSVRTAEDIATKAKLQDLGNRAVSPSDYASGLTGALGALATGNVGALGAMASGAASAFAHKLIRERGRSVVAEMANSLLKLDQRVDGVAARLRLLPRAGRSAATRASVRPDYDVWADSIRHVASDPNAKGETLANLTGGISSQYPALSGRVQQVVLGDIDYLARTMPKSVTGQTLTPKASSPNISKIEKQKWVSRVHALADTPAVLEDIEKGHIDEDAIEALKERRPQLYSWVRQRVMEEVGKRDEELPYLSRVQLSMVFDFDGDPSLSPGAIRSIQASAPPPEKPRAPQSKVALNPKAADSYSLSSEKEI